MAGGDFASHFARLRLIYFTNSEGNPTCRQFAARGIYLGCWGIGAIGLGEGWGMTADRARGLGDCGHRQQEKY